MESRRQCVSSVSGYKLKVIKITHSDVHATGCFDFQDVVCCCNGRCDGAAGSFVGLANTCSAADSVLPARSKLWRWNECALWKGNKCRKWEGVAQMRKLCELLRWICKLVSMLPGIEHHVLTTAANVHNGRAFERGCHPSPKSSKSFELPDHKQCSARHTILFRSVLTSVAMQYAAL